MKRYADTIYLVPVLLLAGLIVLPALSWAAGAGNKGQIVLYSYGPARVQITGPDGSRAGADLGTGGELTEIIGSDVVIEKAGDRSDGWIITLINPAPGTYRFNLLGTGTGGVVMDLEARNSSGGLSSSHVFRKVRFGDIFEYTLDYNIDPKSKNQLKEATN